MNPSPSNNPRSDGMKPESARSTMSSVELEEQQEKIRRVVDEWRCRSQNLLNNLSKDPYQSSTVFDGCSSNSDPIRVCAEPLEHSSFSNLIDSENVGVAKFITVLSYDCNEISRFTGYARRNICKQLVLFGHGSSPQEMLLEGEPQKAFGHSLSLFMELFEITRQMSAVMCNLLQQLDFIYSLQDKNGTPCKSFKSVTLVSAFSSFADGLALILTLDEILAQNSRIKSYLSLFARMLNKVKAEVYNFGIAVGDLDDLDQVVNHLEKLLNLGLFQRLLQEELSWAETLLKVKRNKKFLNACTSCVNDGLSEILPRLDTWKESLLDRRSILHYLGLFLFHVYASAQIPDKRSGNVIMKTLQVIPVIYSEGGCRLVLLDILRSHFPPSLSPWPTLSNAARESVAAKNTFLIHLNDMYSRDWQSIKDALACWVASFQSTIHPMNELSKVEACLALHFKQIIQGILLANRIQMMAISILDLHALLEVPIRRERLKSLCHLVVLMKVVESTFHKKELDIIQSLPHMINLIQADIEHSLLCVKEKLMLEVSRGTQVSKMALLSSLTRGGKDRDTQLTDSLSLVLISLQMLQGGGCSQRFSVLSTALDVLQSIGHVDIDYSRIKKLIYKVNIIAKFQSIVKEVTDCSFLYWRKEMIVTWFSMVYMDVNKFSWLQYLLDAFGDGLWFLKLGHVGKSTVHAFEEELENAVKNEIIAPLCRDIETDLRLHVHSTHLKGSVQVNPRKTGVRNLSWYLQLRPLRLPYKSIDIKFHVDSYLYSAFYKYTAMSSYNWKIYLEMRQLAGLKYGLVLDETHLSDHSLESLDNGVDVPAILQNLEEFATSYMYSMTNQVFIEKTSNCQVRNTLRVFCTDHVASSITAYGLGMIPSASNSVLRFLTKKILAMSDILQENAVNSLSVKEFIFWKCEKETTNSYPLVQGEERNVAMKLPFADHEIKFLERLCCIITEMGNVLGLMRVLQAGGSRHAHNSSRFLYKPKSTTSFAEHSQELGLIDETIIAGKIVDATIENTYQAEDHLKCLSSLSTAFTKEFKSNENLLLRDFYLVIPPLIIYFVDSKISCKDNILRRGRDMENQITTDDGFMMGIVIILKVTEQEKSFDGLHWFENANKRLEEELLSLEGTRDREKHRGNGGLALLKLWGQTSSPISPEVQKGIDKLKRYQKKLELVQCGLNITRTLLSYN